MPLITALGNGGLVWIAASLIMLFSESYKIQGYMIIASISVTTIIGEGLIKHLIKRTRPFVALIETKLLITKPITYSFPSGHTASSFAAVGIMLAMNNSWSILALLLASLIAFSRVYLNVHYPTDVLMGIILGLLCSYMVLAVFRLKCIDYVLVTLIKNLTSSSFILNI